MQDLVSICLYSDEHNLISAQKVFFVRIYFFTKFEDSYTLEGTPAL